jgi:hypothetical protein
VKGGDYNGKKEKGKEKEEINFFKFSAFGLLLSQNLS